MIRKIRIFYVSLRKAGAICIPIILNNSDKKSASSADSLRQKAEELLQSMLPVQGALRTWMSEAEALKFVHELQVHQIELELQNEELLLAIKQAEACSKKFTDLYDFAPSGYITLSREGEIIDINVCGSQMLGRERSGLKNSRFGFFVSEDTKAVFSQFLEDTCNSVVKTSCDVTISNDGNRSINIHMTGISNENGEQCLVSMADITELILKEDERAETARLVTLLNSPGDFRKNMAAITASLQGWSGCNAVGIRLHDGDDYPYYETSGFPAKFLEAENYLCSRDGKGTTICDSAGTPVLDCMCGNVLQGRFDPAKPFFTAHGSFWSNNTTALLASTTEAGRQALTRNRCNGEGYESVALIPLRYGDQVLGLLQFNDHRTNRFNPGLIACFEKMAGTLAAALSLLETQKELRRSQLLLESNLESQKDTIIFCIDQNYRYLFLNKAHSDVMKLAYNMDVKVGMDLMDCIPSEVDRKRIKKNFTRALKGESHTTVQQFGDIELAWYESFYNPVFNENKKIIGATALARNITARKQMDQLWEARFRLTDYAYSHTRDEFQTKLLDELELLTGSQIGFFHSIEADQKSLILQSWSTNTMQKMCKAEGKGRHYNIDQAGFWADALRERKAVIHNNCESLTHRSGLPEGHSPVFRQLVLPIMRKDIVVALVGVGNKLADFTERDIEAVSMLSDMAWDILERKRSEEELLLSERHFRELADSITDVFFEMDRNLRYTFWNKASEILVGIPAETAIGKSLPEIFPDTPEIRKAETEYKEAIRLRCARKFETTYETGNEFYVFENRVYPTVSGISIFTTNITDLKRAEAEIQIKNEELLKLNDEKDKFFSVIAHDLRSPFNTLLGFTKMMVEELPTLTPDEIHTIAVSMRTSATNLYRLLENLLEWSRMQRGLTTFDPETFFLMPKVAESLQSVLAEAKIKGIEIHHDIPEEMEVFADEFMLESIIRNLASNALKFTHKGGKISISAKAIAGNFIQISIQDTGVGMNKDLLDNLFLLNDQKSRRGTEGEAGTGLGLIICKDFIEKHGGKIWVESEVGTGSIFFFTISAHA